MSSKLILIIGLAFNTIGALILLIPYINPWKRLSDQFIVADKDKDKDDPQYIQNGDIKNMATSLAGFILLAVGFILQLIGTIVS